MEFESFYMEHTQGVVNHVDGQVPKPSVLDDLLGVSSTSMDVDPSSVNGETELNAYMRVQQVANDTDPLMWWKQHQQEFPRLSHMTRQYLDVPASSASPERLFKSVGLVKSDWRGSLLDTTLIDVMWVKQAPQNQLEREQEEVNNHQDINTIYRLSGMSGLASNPANRQIA